MQAHLGIYMIILKDDTNGCIIRNKNYLSFFLNFFIYLFIIVKSLVTILLLLLLLF